MHLYLVRHAESANNHLYATTGGSAGRHPDPPLTERGHRQAQAVARYLAARPDDTALSPHARRHSRGGFALTYLYCSLMVRAIATAGTIAEATGLPLQAWPAIHERGGLHDEAPDTGEAIFVAGPGRAFFETTYPHLILPDTLGEAGWWNRARETPDEYRPRAQTVLAELLARHGDSDDRVALVTHAGFFQSFMEAMINPHFSPTLTTNPHPWWFSVNNASVTYVELSNDRAIVRYVNKVEHLSDDLLSG
jgi:2,3-bisphosphoglycerate-dependent phosphoglycerate mutase